MYPTAITPIAQSIPQPPPILQQQQREGEDQGGNVCVWQRWGGAIWVAHLMPHRTNEEETALIFVHSNF